MELLNRILDIYAKQHEITRDVVKANLLTELNLPLNSNTMTILASLMDLYEEQERYRMEDELLFECAEHGIVEIFSKKEVVHLFSEDHIISTSIAMIVNGQQLYINNNVSPDSLSDIKEAMVALINTDNIPIVKRVQSVHNIFPKNVSWSKVSKALDFAWQCFFKGASEQYDYGTDEWWKFKSVKANFICHKYIAYIASVQDKDPQYILSLDRFIYKNIDNWVKGLDSEIKPPKLIVDSHYAIRDELAKVSVQEDKVAYQDKDSVLLSIYFAQIFLLKDAF